MAIQRNSNVLVAAHIETAINVQATATGATQVRILGDSAGLEYKRAPIMSNEKNVSGLKTMPRLGYESVEGSYNTEATVGGHTDLFLAGLLRATWATATAADFATMTVAFTTNALTATAGSWITAGVRVGDIFVVSGTSVAGNNNLNVRALSVTTLTIVVPAATYTTLAATVTGTLTILKKLETGTTPVRQSFTIEEYDGDIDLTQLYTGCRIVGGRMSFKPGSPVTIQYTLMGADRQALASGASPYFTSPSLTTGLSLVTEDSALRYNGAVAATFTGFDLDFTIAAAGQPVIGSTTTPDIFDGDMTVSGTVTGLISDFSDLTLFDAETEFDLSIKLEEPNTGPPKNCLAFFLPRGKIMSRSAPVGGGEGDGAKIQTLGLAFAAKVAATGVDGSICNVHSSAAYA